MKRSVALTAALLALGGLGTSTAAGRGEFKREVPQWWLPGAWCVHRYEGSWTDPGGPYWGGMQLNWAFMAHYGGWSLRHLGTADHWPVKTQLLVAYRGWKVQGWGAWPNTARMCGLL